MSKINDWVKRKKYKYDRNVNLLHFQQIVTKKERTYDEKYLHGVFLYYTT